MKKIIPFLLSLLLLVLTFPKTSFSQTPKLTVTDLSSLSLNVGNVGEFVYLIRNGGAVNSKIDSIAFRCHQNANIWYFPTGLGNDSIYLTYKHDSLPVTYYTRYNYPYLPHHNMYHLFDTTGAFNNYIDTMMLYRLTGRGYLRQNDTVYLHIPFIVINCSSGLGATDFYRVTNGHLVDTNNENNSVNVDKGNPRLLGRVIIYDSASFCSGVHKNTAEIGFNVTDTDNSVGLSVPPYADSIRLYMYCDSSVSKMDTNSFRINGLSISHTYITYYKSGQYNMYLVDLTKYPAGVNGQPFGSNTVSDLSGNGYADQLAQYKNLEVTATIIYDTGCPPYGNCSSTSWTMPGLVGTWNDQCYSLPHHSRLIAPTASPMYSDLTRYLYSASTLASTMTAPADITNSNPDFNVAICPDYQQFWTPFGFKFDCPHPDYKLVMHLPLGYHLDTSALTQAVIRDSVGHIFDSHHSNIYTFKKAVAADPYLGCGGAADSIRHATIEEFYRPYDSIVVVNFGKLPLSNCIGGTAYVPTCFNMPLILTCSDFTSHNVNIEADNLSYSFEFVCDTLDCGSCGDVLTCANTSTYHHCAGECSSPPYTDQGWIFERTNFGDSNLSYPTHYYNTCGASPGIIPSGSTIAQDSLYLDSAMAYPGDQVQALINGGFDSIPKKFNSIYLQIRYAPLIGAVGSPYYLYERDPDKQSYFIVTGCAGVPAINGIHLPLPHCPLSNRSCGDVYSGTVQMNYSLLDAIDSVSPTLYTQFINDTVNEALTISGHIYLRVRNDGNFIGSPYFLSNGKHVVNVRAEYMAKYVASGDTVHSCDSWGNSMTLLQPNPSITLGEPTDSSTCDTFNIKFLFKSPGALTGADDFPNEFRPFAELDSVLSITLPAKYTYTGTQFYTYIDNYNSSRTDNHFSGGATKQFFTATPVITHPGGKTLLTYTGLNNSCWPLIDQKLPNNPEFQGYSLTISTLPSCSAGGPDTVTCIAGYKVGTQQQDTNYMVHVKNQTLREIITHHNPVVSLNVPPTVTDYSNLISFTFKICNTSNFETTVPWIDFENVASYDLNIGSATLYDSVTHVTYSKIRKGYDYWNGADSGVVFNLYSLGGDSCHTLTFSAYTDSNSSACPPPIGVDSGKMVVRFGNVCSGTITNPDSAHCQNVVDTFHYHIYPTTLQVFENSYSPSFVCLKGDTLVDNLVIESANLGSVSNPKLWVYPPVGSGIVVDSIVETYPCDTVTFTPHKGTFAADTTIYSSGSTVLAYGWNFNKDLHINGLPGTLVHPSSSDSNNICVKVYLIMNCAYNGTSPIKYVVTGLSTCNSHLSDSVKVTPKVDDTCCLNLPVCTNPDGKYDLIINNQSARSLHGGATSYGCKNILVVGTYFVNENVTFDECNIAFAPHALIDIDSNHTLNISTNHDTCSFHSECSHLYGACDTMWRGIFIEAGSELDVAKNVLLEDADTAIYAENTTSTQATYKLGGDLTVLNKNFKDIVVRPYNHYYTGYATNCLFTCRDFDTISPCDWFTNYHDAPFATLKYPHTGQITSVGWQIDSVNHFEENRDKIGGINCFDNLNKGILCYGSNVVICTDTFQNFRSFPAIISNGDTSHPDSLYVGGPNTYTEANIFNNCYKGVLAQNGFSSVNVVYNRFRDSAAAVFPGLVAINVAKMDVTGSTLNIEEDSIVNFQDGIVLNLNTHVTSNIIYNTITDTVCTDSTRIGILANEAGSSSATYTIDANNITIFNDGIAVNDLVNCTIASNHISLGNKVNGCASSRYKGFGVNATGCSSPIISCNTVTAPATSVVNPNGYKGIVEKQSTNVLFVSDTTVRPHIHILFNGTSTGDLWYNNLTGVAGDTGIQNKGSGISDYGSNADPTDNKFSGTFTCKTSLSPIYHTTMAILFITPSCPLNYSHTNLVGSHTCPTVPSIITSKTARVIGGENADTVGVDSVMLATMLNTALSQDTFYVNRDTNRTLAKLNVLSMLWHNPYLLANNILSKFNDSMSHAPIGQIMAIDTEMVSEHLAVSYLNLSSTLNTVRPNNNIERYLQIATQGYLDYRINGKVDANELTTLRRVANMCPDFNGQGVYLARSLVSLCDTVVVIYDDACSGNENERTMSTKKDMPENLFRLYPNPNNGGFTVVYNLQQGQTGELVIYNMLGEKEAEYLLATSDTKMNITNSYLNAGIHLYVIRVNNNEVKRDKLIIIK